MKLILGLLVVACLAACSEPLHTDVDVIFEEYANVRNGFEYERQCEKSKEFRGFKKFRVSCLTSTEEGAWEDSSGPHQTIFYYLNINEFRHVGSTNTPNFGGIAGSTDLAVQVFERPTRQDFCNRRIYIDVQEIFESEKLVQQDPSYLTLKGTRIIIADLRALFCDDARKYIPDQSYYDRRDRRRKLELEREKRLAN